MKHFATILLSLLSTTFISAQESSIDELMKSYNMVDITTLDSSILVELKYSTTDNFVGVDMYGDLERAYLEREFAQKVVLAQSILKREYPNLTLLIYDAARPISAQRAMRRCVESSALESFVADGTRGGRHNYGVAVDLTIATTDGTPLDMGAEFDEFSEASSVKGSPDTSDKSSRTIDVYRGYITELANRGIITYEAAQNRTLLVEVMYEAGLYPYRKEWWHYEDIMPMSSVRSKYRLLDF
jgi:D-alanyl-D-alanine dipeptidase